MESYATNFSIFATTTLNPFADEVVLGWEIIKGMNPLWLTATGRLTAAAAPIVSEKEQGAWVLTMSLYCAPFTRGNFINTSWR
jgi:hypothetical protein